MALRSSFFNSVAGDRVYDASVFAEYFASFIGNGVFPNPGTNLQVVAGANLTTQVRPGKGWINGYYLINDSDLTIQHPPADGILGRVDRIVMGLSLADRSMSIYVKPGTPSSNPQPSPIIRNGTVYELVLAAVYINRGVTSINTANIVDLRSNNEVCGFVTGTVEQVDTTVLFNQYQAFITQQEQAYETDFLNWSNQQRTEFNNFLESIRDALDQNVAGNLQNQIIETNAMLDTLRANLNSEIERVRTNPDILTTVNENLQLGPNIASGLTWNLGAGWTGNEASGFTHTSGNTAPLTLALTNISFKLFIVELTITPTAVIDNGQSDYFITLGGSNQFETYRGGAQVLTQRFGIRAPGVNNTLSIIPWTGWAGRIYNISVREVLNVLEPNLTVNDSNGTRSFESRTALSPLNNIFQGKNSGRYTEGDQNTAVGHETLTFNSTGFWNQAFGYGALQNNTVGSRNVGIGRFALRDNIEGDRNVGIGTFALIRNTTGRSNIGVGADALFYNTTGSFNIALGLVAMGSNTSGRYNIGIGDNVMHDSEGGQHNVALGALSLNYNRGQHNIALGFQSAYRNTTGNDNIGMGNHSLFFNNTGSGNVGIGMFANYNNLAGNNNVAIGTEALYNNTVAGNIAIGFHTARGNTIGTGNVAIGENALESNQAGSGNVAIGIYAGNRNTNSLRNTLIGNYAGFGMTSGQYNTFIGSNAGFDAVSGDNNIVIGYNVQKPSTTSANTLNIGNAIRGDLTTRVITIENLLLSNLPTTNPGVRGRVWNNNGTLAISQ